ncbi:MAG: hypothetical protein ACW98D_19190 [Promethearchaeota archaeon]
MRVKLWIYLFIIFALYGTIGEIVINGFFMIFRGVPLWIYYNEFSTSWESFILFGLFGCIGYKLFKKFGYKVFSES